jgi:hypothetical protein
MLYDFDHGGIQVTAVPFRGSYQSYLRRLTRKVGPQAIVPIKAAIDTELVAGIVTTSWMPGADWTGTVYQPLYDAVADFEEGAKFFGLVVCDCVLNRCGETNEDWGYGHYELYGIPIKGRTYFRMNPAPTRAAVAAALAWRRDKALAKQAAIAQAYRDDD